MKKAKRPKEERSALHRTSASRTEAATSKASTAAVQDSRTRAISTLNTMAKKLLAYVERTPTSIVTPAKPRP